MEVVKSAFSFLNQGWVGSTIGLAGVIISGILYFRAKRRAKPSVQFSRMTIVSPQSDELPSDVEILYKGSKINQLTKTNIILWNDGTETLHGSSVVEDSPVQICFEEGVTILRHQIVKETRSVNRSRLEPVENQRNAINIKFDYLDPADGINVEILHDSKSDPTVVGAIRGLPSGIRIVNSMPSSTPAVALANRMFKLYGLKFVMILMIAMGGGLLSAGVLDKLGFIEIKPTQTVESETVPLMITGCIYAFFPSVLLWLSRKRYPKKLNV